MSSSSAGGSGRDICPSCQVCGGEASGFHYGVDSCEGCKGFFRRCVTQGMTNRCANKEKCEITPFSRNSCQFCRLKKCFAVGMSREGSRLGRRPKNLKKCQGHDPKAFQSTSSFHSSSTITSSTLEANPNVNRSLDSSDLDKLRLSVSSDYRFSTEERPGCRPPLLRDGFYGLNSLEHIGAARPSIHSKCPSTLFAPQSTFQQHANSLPLETTLPRGFPGFSPSCLRHPTEICDAGPAGHGRSQSASSGWSENPNPKFVSDVGSDGRFARSSSCVFGYNSEGYDPETATISRSLSYIKQENPDDYDDETAPLERDLGMKVSEELYGRHGDPSMIRDFRENAENGRRKDDSKHLTFHWRLKGDDREITAQIQASHGAPLPRGSSSAGAAAVSATPACKTEFPECGDRFGAVADGDAGACGEIQGRGFLDSSPSLEVLISEAMKSPDHAKMRLMKHVIATVVDAHMNTCNYTSQKVAEGAQRYKDSASTGQGQSAWKDLDPSKIWNHFVDNMAPVITRVVKFSKKIPGFSELHQEDQIGLIKQGSFEVILTRYTRLFTDDGMFVPDMTTLVPRDVIPQMPMGKFFEEQFQFAEMFNRLRLDDSEVGLLTASMVTCPGRTGLLNSSAIHQLHILLLQSLYTYMKQTHPETCDDLFSRTIHVLPFIRRINASHAKQLNDIKMSTPQLLFPPLHDEVFDKMG